MPAPKAGHGEAVCGTGGVLATALAALALAAPAAGAQEPMRDVVFVANAEGGTVSVVDAQSHEVVRTIDVLPDGPRARLGEDAPLQALAGQLVVELAGGLNYAQDQDLSPDGRTLYVSRGHRGDVAAFDVASGRMLWKLPVNSLRADHMTLSADGTRLYVSALTANRVEVIDTRSRRMVGWFATGEWPHDSHLSHDGARIYNASIGNIVLPEALRGLLGDAYVVTVADPRSLAVRRRHVFDRGVRPFAVTGDESRMYAQLSLFHGVVEYDLVAGRELRRLQLPVDPGVTEEDYDFEAPHHGLALSPDERTLCLAGRASDYVALVDTGTFQPREITEVDDAPSWAANSPGGDHCFVANTRGDTLSVISYADGSEVERVRVGNGPKHLEPGRVPASVLAGG